METSEFSGNLALAIEALDQFLLSQKLKRENESRDRLISMLAHDLRNPLTVIKSSAQLVLRRPENTAAQLDRMMQMIVDRVNRADDMICALLDFNKLKSEELLVPIPEGFDLRDLCMELLEEVRLTQGDRIALKCEGPVQVRGSRRGIRRIFENLVKNAFKYGDVRTPVTIAMSPRGSWIRFAVHNLGTPIPKSEQQSIFNAFQQGASGAPRLSDGWGLGLALVRKIVDSHSGRIRLRSSPRFGTCFIVRLPAVPRTPS
jgi:signal transduction histidine kinase